MRAIFAIGLTLVFVAALDHLSAAQEKKETEKPLQFSGEDFPIQKPEAMRDKEEDVKRKIDACKTKYEGKLVRAVGMVVKRPGPKDEPPVYTLTISCVVQRDKKYFNFFQDVDVIPGKAAPELNQQPRAGLIAEIVGQGHIDARGRLVLKDARVLSTSTPPG